MCERVADRVADRGEDRVGTLPESIVHPESLTTRLDQTRPTQIGQMTGGLGLRDLQTFVNVADAHFSGEQQAENP
jgi:hypothetical protein